MVWGRTDDDGGTLVAYDFGAVGLALARSPALDGFPEPALGGEVLRFALGGKTVGQASEPMAEIGDLERGGENAGDAQAMVLPFLAGAEVGGEDEEFSVEAVGARLAHKIGDEGVGDLIVDDDEIERGGGEGAALLGLPGSGGLDGVATENLEDEC